MVCWWMGLCCGFVVLVVAMAMAVAVGLALGLGLGWGGRMGLRWGVCGVLGLGLGLGYGVADLGFGFGLWGCRCYGGGSGWFVGGWVYVVGLGSVRVGCCRGFGFREGGGIWLP